jgi:hypothetical protein
MLCDLGRFSVKYTSRLLKPTTARSVSIPGASTRKTSDDALLMRVYPVPLAKLRHDAGAARLVSMSAPKPARAVDVDPVIAAFENAPEEPMTEEERAAFEEALADTRPGMSTEELLESLRPKP